LFKPFAFLRLALRRSGQALRSGKQEKGTRIFSSRLIVYLINKEQWSSLSAAPEGRRLPCSDPDLQRHGAKRLNYWNDRTLRFVQATLFMQGLSLNQT
jgi:hypothetical protein